MHQRVYVIGDTHFGHKKVVTFRPYETVEEHDRDLVERWNATVTDKDTVWHLGDVSFGGPNNHELLGALKGRKKLVMGNHDNYPTEFYLRFFVRLHAAVEVKGALLTHIPVNQDQFARWPINVHGHLHSRIMEDARYRCVSAEQTDYRPVLLSEVIA